MSENLYIPSHRVSNPKMREEWDRIFKKKEGKKCESQKEKEN